VSNTNPHQKPMGKQLVIKHMPRKRLVIDRRKKNIYVKTGNYYIFDVLLYLLTLISYL